MDVLQELEIFYNSFNGEKGIIGKSFYGKDIKYLAVKKTEYPKIIAQYSIHAREYITAYLALKQITEFEKLGKRGAVYFIPVSNPDGVSISLTKYPLWKANGRGVDLNVNFDANWGTGEANTRTKGSQNYIGEYPFSEPETVALRDFTLKISPSATLSYHSKGEEIYWYFSQPETTKNRDYALAKLLSDKTGYHLKLTPNSAGGYKDWCIQTLKIPSFTVEVGSDELSHPVKKQNLSQIYAKNKGVIPLLSENL